MKKLYAIMLGLALGLSAQARELTFYLGDEVIAPASEIEFNDITVEDMGAFSIVTMAPDLYISSDIYTSELNITATCTSGQTVQMCAGGACKSGQVVKKENVKVQAGAKLPLRFDFETELGPGEPIPNVVTLLEAQDGDFEQTHKQFVITMGQKGSVETIELPAGVRVLDGALAYELSAPARLTLYNAAGACVLDATLDGCGTISTAHLAKGIYVYALGKTTGKIFIK